MHAGSTYCRTWHKTCDTRFEFLGTRRIPGLIVFMLALIIGVNLAVFVIIWSFGPGSSLIGAQG